LKGLKGKLEAETLKAMQNPMQNSNAADSRKSLPASNMASNAKHRLAGASHLRMHQTSSVATRSVTQTAAPRESVALMERPAQRLPQNKPIEKRATKRKRLSQNFVLKRFDLTYWRRLLRYFYIRFLRMQGSPHAIARGVAAGVFAGSFPLLGFQTIIGVALAALVRGNKIMAAAATWISNPLTYVPIFALNFKVGCWLLRQPIDIVIPSSTASMDEWMSMGMSATAALMVGSCIVGTVAGLAAYSLGLRVALLREKKRLARK